MKAKANKRLVAAILASLTLATAAPAFAAANPFVDVPAKHWAYDSVSKLAAAGIVDGYGDGTFRGDRTMTRYEMAQIVAKAMARSDKANAEQKAMIDKLAQEFGDELHNLGVRVSNLENKVGNITWTGQVREWYEWVDKGNNQAGSNALRTRILLWANAPLTNDLAFTGRFWAESKWGTSDNGGWNSGSGTGADTSLDEAYLTYKHGNTTATFGRQPLTLGKGLIYNMGPNNDGATVTVGDKVKLTVAAFRSWALGLGYDPTMSTRFDPNASYYSDYYWRPYFWGWYKEWHDHYYPTYDIVGPIGYNPNMVAANVSYQVNKDLDLTVAYAKNRTSTINLNSGTPNMPHLVTGDAVDTLAFGLGYKGIKNVTVTAEYGQNRADWAKFQNKAVTGDNGSPKAWVGQIKYKGAEWTKPHTYGVWVGYRHAEPGFLGVTGDPLWETPSAVPTMNNVKGPEYGFDYTLFKNGVFTFNYLDLEDEAYGKTDYKSLTAQLRYFF